MKPNGIVFQKHAIVVVCRIRLLFCKQVNIDGTSVSNKACDIEINATLVQLHFWKKKLCISFYKIDQCLPIIFENICGSRLIKCKINDVIVKDELRGT